MELSPLAFSVFILDYQYMEREEDYTKLAFAEAYRKLQSQSPTRRITVKDIAATAGYDRHTFYYHFKSLQDLVSWIFDTEVAKIMDEATGDWSDIIRNVINYTKNNKALVLALYHSSHHAETMLFLQNKFGKMMDVFLNSSDYVFTSKSEMHQVSAFITGGCIVLFFQWLGTVMEREASEIAEELLDIVTKCLLGYRR